MAQELAAVEHASGASRADLVLREYPGWFGRAAVSALPSALIVLTLDMPLDQWLVIALCVACHAAFFAWISVLFGAGSGFLAKFTRALRVAVWVRAGWAALALLLLTMTEMGADGLAGVAKAPVIADVWVGDKLLRLAERVQWRHDLPADADEGYEGEGWKPSHDLRGSYVAVFGVTFLQGVAIASQLGVIALLLAAAKSVRPVR